MTNSEGNIDEWLASLELSQYEERFAANDIDISVLSLLREEYLRELDISIGYSLRILDAASRVAGKSEMSALTVPARAAALPLDGAPSNPVSAASAAERRQVTVMFCDLVGSTALSASLDPEDVRELLTEYHASCQAVIDNYDGFVVRLRGDGVLAYFGYPTPSGHDAQNALNAALSLVAASSELGKSALRGSAVNLEVRVGIATGTVVIGDLIGEAASLEHNVVGETPNLAARMLAANGFEFEPRGAHAVKGFDKTIHVWQSIDATEPLEAVSNNDSRQSLVGRQAELELLRRAMREGQSGSGQLVLLSGEPGIGKSRLSETVGAEAIAAGFRAVTLRCAPYQSNRKYHPRASTSVPLSGATLQGKP